MLEIQMDIFRWNALIKEDNGKQVKYYIEFKEGFYCLFVQRKKGKTSKWSKAKVIEKSTKKIIIDFSVYSEVGLKSLIVA